MAGELVLDACVAAKAFFDEPGSAEVRRLLTQADGLLAPDLVLIEVANVAVKKARGRTLTAAQAREVAADVRDLFDLLVPTGELLAPAMDFALTSMTSTYDAVYAALAAREGATLVTADRRFASSLRGVRGAPNSMVIET